MTPNEPLSLFALDAEMEALERELQNSPPPPLALLVALAWHSRQRDTRRGLKLVETAEALLSTPTPLLVETTAFQARLALVRAEAHWLFDEPQAARVQLEAATALFQKSGDAIGLADTQWLLSSLALDSGDVQVADQHLECALNYLEGAGDDSRLQVTLLRRCVDMAMRDAKTARFQLDEHVQLWSKPEHPVAATWWHAAHAIVLSQEAKVGECVRHTIAAQELAQASGQMRMAVLIASNVGIRFENLQDMAAAMVWHDRALSLGRRLGWPGVLALVQCRAASAVCDMSNPQAALDMLQAAVWQLPQGSRAQALGWLHMGEALHALGQHAEALSWMEKSLQRFRDMSAFMDVSIVLQRQTLVAMAMEDLDHAARFIAEAMEVAATNNLLPVKCWLHMDAAQLCLAGRGGKTEVSTDENGVLIHLLEALRIARSIDGFNVPPLLLDRLAAEHASQGNMGDAYRVSLEAAHAREIAQGQEAVNRTVALQVTHETERHKLEAEHLRELGREQARREEELVRANATLEQLGEVGRSITASLDADAIFSSLNELTQQLLDAHSVVISRSDPEMRLLRMAYGMEGGEPVEPFDVAMDNPDSMMARCARQRREIVTEADIGVELTLPGTAVTQSWMFSPLVVGERLWGVMTVQSLKANAYKEREVAIFRTLCAYGAIALANAEAQAKVVAQNRELELAATVDTLTGLFNRRHLNQVLAREMASAERLGGRFSLILLDIDHFKRVNDEFGHPIGDLVLTCVGAILKGRVRAIDTAGRWGGEEFLLICPGTAPTEAALLAESLRQAIEAHTIAEVGHCTASFGVAGFRPGDSIRNVEQRADQAMYQAKQAGRNRVVCDPDLY